MKEKVLSKKGQKGGKNKGYVRNLLAIPLSCGMSVVWTRAIQADEQEMEISPRSMGVARAEQRKNERK